MKKFFYENKYFFSLYISLLLVMVMVMALFDKGEINLALNIYHSEFFDDFFKNFTKLCDPIYVIGAIVIALYRYSCVLYYLASSFLSYAIIYIMKPIFHMPRPRIFFENNPDFLQIIVPGIKLKKWDSFPSGHSGIFFISFACISIILVYLYNKGVFKRITSRTLNLMILFGFILASLGAYSRIYLSQHFLMDVCAGSLISVLCAISCYPLLDFFERKEHLRTGFLKKIDEMRV